MSSRILLALAPIALASLTGCSVTSSENDTFHFGVADMESVATGDFDGTLTRAGKKDTAMTLRLDHVVKTSQPQCGTRELYHTECIDLSELGVRGKLTTADKTYDDVTVTGQMQVYGLDLAQGELTFNTPDNQRFYVTYKEGAYTDGGVQTSKGDAVGTFTLTKH
jgi:hypothetical protein